MGKTLRRFECEKHSYSFDRWSEHQSFYVDPVLCPTCVKAKLVELGVVPLEGKAIPKGDG